MTRIRSRLVLIATLAIVPLALMAAIALEALLSQQRQQAKESALNLTRALATAIDNELRLTVSALQSLALTEPFGAVSEEGLAQAQDLATKALAARPEWQAVLLVRPSGDVVLDTIVPAGTKLPRVSELKSIAEVVRTGEPAVGPLTAGTSGFRGIPVRVPVIRDGTLRYVLSAIVKPEVIVAVVNRQRVPPAWTVSVFDSDNVRVARSRDQEKLLGTAPGASLSQLMSTLKDRDEGFGESSTLEGERVNTALGRMRTPGWIVTLGMPQSVANRRCGALSSSLGVASSCRRCSPRWRPASPRAVSSMRSRACATLPARSAAAIRCSSPAPASPRSRPHPRRWSVPPLCAHRASASASRCSMPSAKRARAPSRPSGDCSSWSPPARRFPTRSRKVRR